MRRRLAVWPPKPKMFKVVEPTTVPWKRARDVEVEVPPKPIAVVPNKLAKEP